MHSFSSDFSFYRDALLHEQERAWLWLSEAQSIFVIVVVDCGHIYITIQLHAPALFKLLEPILHFAKFRGRQPTVRGRYVWPTTRFYAY